MPLESQTKHFLTYLRSNPQVRARIAAPPGRTLLYAGAFFKPVWRELEQLKRTSPAFASKEMLPDVLARIATPGESHPNLLAWAKSIDGVLPWNQNGFIAWRALSGIFASNAIGSVSFYVGSEVDLSKVFVATEVGVLLRNPKIDALTREILGYYERCIRAGNAAVNFGYTSA